MIMVLKRKIMVKQWMKVIMKQVDNGGDTEDTELESQKEEGEMSELWVDVKLLHFACSKKRFGGEEISTSQEVEADIELEADEKRH